MKKNYPKTKKARKKQANAKGSFPVNNARRSIRRAVPTKQRRQSEEPFEGEEKRQEPQRRLEKKRRSIPYDLTCSTSGSITEIEDWLDNHCEGKWKMILEDIDDDLVKKNLRVMFEYAEEREKFFRLYIKEEE